MVHALPLPTPPTPRPAPRSMLELEALPPTDVQAHLTTHELMDLALSWHVVKSAAEFWRVHKSKEDLCVYL